jgi:hypothetical protein
MEKQDRYNVVSHNGYVQFTGTRAQCETFRDKTVTPALFLIEWAPGISAEMAESIDASSRIKPRGTFQTPTRDDFLRTTDIFKVKRLQADRVLNDFLATIAGAYLFGVPVDCAMLNRLHTKHLQMLVEQSAPDIKTDVKCERCCILENDNLALHEIIEGMNEDVKHNESMIVQLNDSVIDLIDLLSVKLKGLVKNDT